MMEKEHKKKRIEYIDTLRVIACFLVILTHSAMPVEDDSMGVWMGGISFLGSPSSELFLALSGMVLLPVHISMREFYKRRFLKLIPPVLCWSFVILVVYICLGKITVYDAFYSFVMIPLRPVVGVYWFIYVMIGLYLLAPIISKWLLDASKKQVQFFLFLWFINLTLPYLNLLVPDFYRQSGSHYWTLNYFGGFIGYWLLGYYLRKWPLRIGMNVGWTTILIFGVGYVFTLLIMKNKEVDISPYMDNLQIGSALLVMILVTIIQKFPIRSGKLKDGLASLAKYSFGIYLIHILVVRDLVWLFFAKYRMFCVFETFSIAIVSLLLSYFILRIISCLPKSKYIIGC